MTSMTVTNEPVSPSAVDRRRIDELLDVLHGEDKVYKQLEFLSEDLQQAVLKRDVEAIRGLTKRTDDLTGEISRLEKERAQAMEWWSEQLKTPSLPTMAEIAMTLGKREGEQLMNLQDKLISRIKRLSEANRQNVDLIRSSLKLINASLAYVGGFLQNAAEYGRNGQQTATGGRMRAIVDCKA